MDFNPRAPCGARLDDMGKKGAGAGISIHAPHAGRDRGGVQQFIDHQPISIHAPHAGRDVRILGGGVYEIISIHAPHAGRDAGRFGIGVALFEISIHAPHAGRD